MVAVTSVKHPRVHHATDPIAVSSADINSRERWAMSCNNSVWLRRNSKFSFAIFRAAKIIIVSLLMSEAFPGCWDSTLVISRTRISATSLALVLSDSALKV